MNALKILKIIVYICSLYDPQIPGFVFNCRAVIKHNGRLLSQKEPLRFLSEFCQAQKSKKVQQRISLILISNFRMYAYPYGWDFLPGILTRLPKPCAVSENLC
jgi:hypothetical protein